jgi:hypothetical protein
MAAIGGAFFSAENAATKKSQANFTFDSVIQQIDDFDVEIGKI